MINVNQINFIHAGGQKGLLNAYCGILNMSSSLETEPETGILAKMTSRGSDLRRRRVKEAGQDRGKKLRKGVVSPGFQVSLVPEETRKFWTHFEEREPTSVLLVYYCCGAVTLRMWLIQCSALLKRREQF